jgi:hypothetical protein
LLAAIVSMLIVDVSPMRAAPLAITSFNATLSDVNKVTLSWRITGGVSNSVYIYDLTDEGNPSVGPQTQLNGSVAFRVVHIGLHRYGLDVRGTSGQVTSRTTSLMIDAPVPPPTVTSSNPILVDSLVPSTPRFTWTKQLGTRSQVVSGFNPPYYPNPPDTGSTTGSYTPPADCNLTLDQCLQPQRPSLPECYGLACPGDGSRTTTWTLRQCIQGHDPSFLCSQPVQLTIVYGPARVTSGARVYVAPGQSTTIAWNAGPSGALYNLASPALNYNQWTGSNSLSVPIPANASGLIDLTLTECNLATGFCANRFDPVAPAAGTIMSIATVGTLVGGDKTQNPPRNVVGTIRQADGTIAPVTTAPLWGSNWGTVGLPDNNPATNQPFKVGDTVAANTPLVAVIAADAFTGTPNAHADHIQVMATNQTWTTTDYTTDYMIDPTQDRWPTWQDPNLGAPIWAQPASNGDIYAVGEFSRGIGQMSTGGQTAAHDVPLLRNNTTSTVNGKVYREQVTPFTYGSSFVSFSEFTEEVSIDSAGKVWFAQGGNGGLIPAQTSNHSRIVSFDPTGTDDPSTVDDERFCAYNAPATSGDGTNNPVFNTTAFGITAVGDRIYFVEYRPGQSSALTWFKPTEFSGCGNYFDFSNINASPTPGYCAHPTDTGCFHLIELPDGSAAYPFYDSADNAIWIGTFLDGALDRYDIAHDTVTSYPLNETHRPAVKFLFLGNVTTGLQIDDSYVYYLGASDGSVNRFNKAMAASGGCTTLTNGDNPCVEQIFLPLGSNVVGGNQLSLSNGKLWFSLGRVDTQWVDPFLTPIGFVDTGSWGPGTIYTGLENTGDPARHNAGPSLFGVEAMPNGAVLVPDYARGELLRLWPNGAPH